MNHNIKTLSLVLVALLSLVCIGSAQTLLTPPTTLSSALTTTYGKTLVVASATGISAPTTPGGTAGSMLYIDKELLTVEAVSSTTITVIRGVSGTKAQPHASGAYVWVGPGNAFGTGLPETGGPPAGSCTRTNELYLPKIDVASGTISDCLNGQWVNGVRTPNTPFRLVFPDSGGTAYTSLNTNGTAVGSTTLYCTSVNLPANKLLTGIGVLNGTTVTGNARYVVLYDAGGTPLANSALAGQASVTASVYETYAFTSKFYAVGPSTYFACLQDNATGSTTVRMVVTGTQDNILTKGQTGATFGTVPTLTVPTTFTSAVGPYVYLY